ncbi:MAG: ADP-ribosyl-[dinitrogen reductase] hydrolase [Deltaproteobacteria bacterium]|nr:ADP-ribosyl-[dinitrogen reductase] hydrolase [Deltaproteobacteria bacterium]
MCARTDGAAAAVNVRERARAAFLGFALGDALGATTEFMTAAEIRSAFGVHRHVIGKGWLGLKPGRVTDDTEMSLCLARAVVAVGRWDLRTAAEHLAVWLKSGPVDVGTTCRRGIRAYLLKGQLETPPDEWDAGNGAAMRMVPVALLTLGADELLERVGVEQAHLTHNHPLSDAACLAVGRMVQTAVLGGDAPALRDVARDLAVRHPVFRFNPYRGECSAYVVDTLRTVFHHFFTTATFEDCLVAVVNQGGDADTAGAIAGAICGGFYGREALPRRWLRRLDRSVFAAIEELAERLVLLSPWVKGRL